MFAWLIALVLAIVPATATMPAVRLDPPAPFGLIDAWSAGCTYTRLREITVTAAHCTNGGWQYAGDIATRGGLVDWADPAEIGSGAVLWAVGYPAGRRVEFTLTAIGSRVVNTFHNPQLVLMAKGVGVPCTSGASGMVAWTYLDGVLSPVGPMSVYSIDPAVTGLPAGDFVCGFAVSG